MPAARRLPDAAVLRRLADEGLSNRKIGAQYGASGEAVRQALDRAGYHRPVRTDHSRYLPWRVRADHFGDVLVKRLRALSKREQNLPLSEQERRLLDEWIRFMDGENAYGVPLAVHYDRTDPEGFWLEPRREGDRDYIHPPSAA